MQSQLSHASSARKKLLQYQSAINREDSQSGYLGRNLSREHGKFMESALMKDLQKEESDRALKRQYSTRGYQSNLSSLNKTPFSSNKKLEIDISSLNASKFKPLKTSKSKKYEQIKIQNSHEEAISQVQQQDKNKRLVPHFYNDTDEIRSARQNELMQQKRIKFEFQFLHFLIEVGIGYGLLIGILYLIKVGPFPYFEVLLVLALTLTISPWKVSNLILPITAVPITVVNYYTGLSSLTYIEILICYLGTMTFNEKFKIKILLIVVVVLEILVGLFFLPTLYRLFQFKVQIFYYLFPIFMFVLRSIVNLLYWIIGYSEILFLQIPLFIIGLQYGIILTIAVGQIEFWYLIVMLTLQIMNERTNFFLKLLVGLVKFCFPQMKTTPTPDLNKKNNHILSAHSNGFSSINSFHLVACIYIFSSLSVSSSPYIQSFSLSMYIKNGQWYKPLIVWTLVSIYEIMCLVLQKKKQNVLLVGHTKNQWYFVLCRGIMLVLGLWMFYIGLGVGAYSIERIVG